MKKILFIVFIVLQNFYCKGQSNLIIYANENTYLVPLMEDLLKGFISKSEESKNPLFKNVVNLSRIIENQRDETITDDTRGILLNDEYLFVNEQSIEKVKLAKDIDRFDFFLKVNIHPLNELLEYQLILYEIINEEKRTDRNNNEKVYSFQTDFLNPKSIVNFFLDPKGGDYEKIIEKNLKKVFMEANNPPLLSLKVVGASKLNILNSRAISIRDTLIIDATQSSDIEENLSDLTFHYRIIDYKKMSDDINALDLDLFDNEPIQKIVFPGEGFFEIGVKCFDGVIFSKEEVLTFYVSKPPIIYIEDQVHRFVDVKSRFGKPPQKMVTSKIKNHFFIIDSLITYSVKRLTSEHLSMRDRRINELFIENQRGEISGLLYPSIIEVDFKSVTTQNAELSGVFKPISNRNEVYRFSLRGEDMGVKSNSEIFKIDYTYIDDLYEINYNFIPAANGTKLLSEDKPYDQNKFIAVENKLVGAPAQRFLGYSSKLTEYRETKAGYHWYLWRNLSLEFGIAYGKIESDNSRFFEDYSIDSNQVHVIDFWERWETAGPYVGMNYHEYIGNFSVRFFANTNFYTRRFSGFILNQDKARMYLPSLHSEEFESFVDSYNARKRSFLALKVGSSFQIRFLRKPTTYLSLGVGGILWNEGIEGFLKTGISININNEEAGIWLVN